ncbi:chromosome segregation protein SMC [Companilactobacillus nodensis]|uniref:Chromosome partition protein Smc n=1 Tax=Companilactobacillus nodensis DSM 19682 = JCM 14932 = NBRC 107160 TaxID=1423775 RepID=A0A0R1KGG1_9LACO|nr:chromosome segregation protein SMC [Companilactobacillus nodensis]KRK79993.1 chromosome seggregation Smc protein [Companilactobacillus nodensis DSM 19682 = JCM 14932 = NBRC 107160]
MPLKSLTINGFKSFADKTKIDFTSGITGIVGPNGSGKSNITEAIRWVMGEQSAKSLRGDKMVDVIFAGSATRAQMNHAEVTLEFDNSNGELKSDQTNITIQRKLFRNGDTEFSINNKACRLRDITEMFMDSGMGKQSFSTISQGRVEEIFNSKPVERRSIIEESAGIALFKQKKTQAENRLSETTDNLHRVSDIVSELSKQVEPLKEQASIARDYKEQKSKYDNIYQQILTIEIKDLSKEKRQTESKLREVKMSLQNIEQQVKISNKEVTDNRDQISKLAEKIDASQADLVKKTQSLEILNGQIAVSDERNGFNTTNQTSLNEQLKSIKADKKLHEVKLSECNEKISEYQSQIQELEAKLKEITQLQKKTPQQIQDDISELRDKYVNTLQEQVSTGNDQKYTQRQLDRIQASNEDTEHQMADIEDDLKESSNKVTEVSAQLQKLIDDNQDLIKKNDEIDNNIKRVTETGTAENQEYLKFLENLQETKARKTVLENMQQEHVGFFEGAKNVLNNQNEIGGIIGAVAELIKVPSKYQLAIETVVSNQLQSIVTKDESSAKQAIAYLRKRNGGRATFLPINIIKARTIYATDLNNAEQVAGYVGVASDLVKFDDKVANIVKNILGNLLIAENIDAATRVSAAVNRKYRVVTLDGNVVNAGGSMTGGQQRRVNSSILTRKDELTSLNAKLSKQEMLLDQKQQTVVDLRQELVDLREEKKKIESKLADFNQEKGQLSSSLSTYTNETKHLEEQRDALQYTANKNNSEKTELQKELNVQIENADKLKQQVTDVQQEIEAKQKLLKDFDSELSQINNNIQKTQTNLAVVKSNFDNEKTQQERLISEISASDEHIKELGIRLDQLNSERDQLSMSNAEIKAKTTQFENDIKLLQADLDDLKSQRSEKDKQAASLNEKAQRNFDLQKSASDEQENLAIAVTKLTNKIDSRLDTLSEDYSLTYEAAMKNLKQQDSDPETLKREARLLKMGIDELGTVNLSAIEEYDKVKDRYEFLTTQQNDLLQARQQLLDTMSEMDNEVTTRFKKTFDEVSAAFETIFPEMFAGGRAKLVLTDPSNLLETGIEIIAQPPGKKFQRLSLLSGGEKALTAITLLFAIIKVHPVPFCILDEVEASLDDANVYRFANYLNRYDANTEFIVITHRKGTMMNVNRLYGVTMEESGVSRMLSVSLQDINKDA